MSKKIITILAILLFISVVLNISLRCNNRESNINNLIKDKLIFDYLNCLNTVVEELQDNNITNSDSILLDIYIQRVKAHYVSGFKDGLYMFKSIAFVMRDFVSAMDKKDIITKDDKEDIKAFTNGLKELSNILEDVKKASIIDTKNVNEIISKKNKNEVYSIYKKLLDLSRKQMN